MRKDFFWKLKISWFLEHVGIKNFQNFELCQEIYPNFYIPTCNNLSPPPNSFFYLNFPMPKSIFFDNFYWKIYFYIIFNVQILFWNFYYTERSTWEKNQILKTYLGFQKKNELQYSSPKLPILLKIVHATQFLLSTVKKRKKT